MSQSLTKEQLARFADTWNQSAMLQWLGFTMEFPSTDIARVSIAKVHAGHRGGKGTSAVNGGALAALYDFAIGCVAVIAPPPLRRSATAQISVSFERAVRGDKVVCEARIDRATKNLIFASAHILDEKGQICSHATGLVSLGEPVDYEEWRNTLSEDSTRGPQ